MDRIRLVLLTGTASLWAMKASYAATIFTSCRGNLGSITHKATLAQQQLLQLSHHFMVHGADGGQSAWSEWVRPLAMGALTAAPLEFGDLWAWAVRYAVYSLAEACDPSLGLLLEVISQPLPEGTPT